MADFNPILNITQGLQAGQAIRESQRMNQIRDLQNALAGQAGSPGFNIQANLDFQQLSALDPDRAAKMLANFQALGDDRKRAYFQDFKQANNLLKANDFEGLERLFSDRKGLVQQLGGDTYQVDYFNNLLQSGEFDKLRQGLDLTEQAGIDAGYLEAPKIMKSDKPAPFQQAEGGLVFNPNTGEYKVNDLAQKTFNELQRKKEQTGDLDVKDVQSLNKDITGFVKNAIAIKDTAVDLENLSKIGSGPAAIAAVFKFMKANDPNSTVREGEYATAEQASGVPAQVRNFYNKLVTGESLTKEQIQQFVETSKVLANSAIDSANQQVGGYLETFGDKLSNRLINTLKERSPTKFEGVSGSDNKITDNVDPAVWEFMTPEERALWR